MEIPAARQTTNIHVRTWDPGGSEEEKELQLVGEATGGAGWQKPEIKEENRGVLGV